MHSFTLLKTESALPFPFTEESAGNQIKIVSKKRGRSNAFITLHHETDLKGVLVFLIRWVFTSNGRTLIAIAPNYGPFDPDDGPLPVTLCELHSDYIVLVDPEQHERDNEQLNLDRKAIYDSPDPSAHLVFSRLDDIFGSW